MIVLEDRVRVSRRNNASPPFETTIRVQLAQSEEDNHSDSFNIDIIERYSVVAHYNEGEGDDIPAFVMDRHLNLAKTTLVLCIIPWRVSAAENNQQLSFEYCL